MEHALQNSTSQNPLISTQQYFADSNNSTIIMGVSQLYPSSSTTTDFPHYLITSTLPFNVIQDNNDNVIDGLNDPSRSTQGGVVEVGIVPHNILGHVLIVAIKALLMGVVIIASVLGNLLVIVSVVR